MDACQPQPEQRSVPAGGGRSVRARPAALAAAVSILALLCALALAAAPASAVIVHLRNGSTVSYQPLRGTPSPLARGFDELFSNLDYNGGPIMPSNTNYTVYWDPSGATKYPSGYQAGVDRYLEDLAHDSGKDENVDSVSAQYDDAAGQFAAYDSHFGGELIDTDPYPANGCSAAKVCLTDAQLQQELTSFVKREGLPTDLEHEYFLLTPPKVEDCFEASEEECSAGTGGHAAYCAYHSNIPEPGGGELIYANDPYVGNNPGCDDGNHPNGISDSAIEGGLSHEHNESITDPEPNSAWTDFGGSGGEEGDKCRTFEEASEFGTPLGEEDGVKYNQVVNGHHYWYQQEWSNQTHQCLQRLAFKGAVPTASFTARSLGGTEVSLDAEASSATGGVYRFNWQFNEEEPLPSPGTPTETAAATIAHAFPIPCTYLVGLTVFAKNGTSSGTAERIKVGEPPAPDAQIAIAPVTPTAGEAVTFDGIAESPDGAGIAEYRWSFGDGSEEAAGAEPQHVYAAPGSYEVTLHVTDVCGEGATVRETLTVQSPSEDGGGGGSGPPPPSPSPSGGGETPAATTTLPSQPIGSGSPLSSPLAPAARSGRVTLPASISVGARGRGHLSLLCTGTAAVCSGSVVLSVRRTTGAAHHRRERTIALATVRFTLTAGSTSAVAFVLSPLGRALLRDAHGRLPVLLTLHLSSPAAPLATAAARIVLARGRR